MEQVGTVLLHCPRLIICQVGECHAEGKKVGGTKTPDADMGQQDPSISGKCLYHWQDTVSYEMARDGKERKKLKSGVQSSTAGPPVCCKRGGRGEALHSTRRGWWWCGDATMTRPHFGEFQRQLCPALCCLALPRVEVVVVVVVSLLFFLEGSSPLEPLLLLLRL